MAQTGKTPKKQQSDVEKKYRAEFSAGRLNEQQRNFKQSPVYWKLTGEADAKMQMQALKRLAYYRRKDATTGRMSFEKARDTPGVYIPSKGIQPKGLVKGADELAFLDMLLGKRPMTPVEDYVERKFTAAKGRPDLPMSQEILKRMVGLPHNLGPEYGPDAILEAHNRLKAERRFSKMRNRPRGKTVSGMMTGPLLAGLGDYIGRNTSVGQQLRSKMMKQQPSRNR